MHTHEFHCLACVPHDCLLGIWTCFNTILWKYIYLVVVSAQQHDVFVIGNVVENFPNFFQVALVPLTSFEWDK